MKHFTPNPSRRNVRVLVATVLSYLMLVGQVAPLALASNNSAMRPAAGLSGARDGSGAGEAQEQLKAAAAPAPAAPVAAGITASKTDLYADADGDGKAAPGEEITYEVEIHNGGTDATGVEFNDTIDPNTTLVGGSVTMSPLARNDGYTASAASPLVVAAAQGVLGNDSGIPAPSAVAATGQATTKGGTVDIAADGSFTYTPPAGPFTGADSFTYTATNANLPNDTATVTISFNPAAVDDSATVAEDSSANNIDVLTNDTDPDGGTNTVQSVSTPANGTAGVQPGGAGVTYTPNADYCNSQPGGTPDTFTYTLNGGSSATVSVTVTCIDDNPTAVNDSATVPEDSAATPVNVLSNDTDPDGGAITITSTSTPANGTAGVQPGGAGVTYTPNPNYCNSQAGGTPDTFTYTLTQGGSSATVSVTVTCSDDAPVAVNDSATVAEDAAATTINVLTNDTDIDGGPMSIASASVPSNGTVVVAPGGASLTYQPNANYNGSDSFTYTLNGGSSATVSVTVTEVNDTPAATNDALTDVLEDSGTRVIAFSALTGNDSAGPTNESGQTLTVTNVGSPVGGTVQIVNGNVEFTPTANFFGAASFTYTVTDNGTTNGVNDFKSTTGTASFTVIGVNDEPSFTKGADQSKNEDDPAATVNGWATAISAGPNETQNLTFVVTNDNNSLFSVQPAVSSAGVLTYTLAANQNGSATVSVYLTDDGGTANGGDDTSPTQTFTITVAAVNDAPVVTAKNYSAQANMLVSIPAGSGLLTGITDADTGVSGCAPTFAVAGVSATTSPAGGNVTFNASTGAFDFNPPPGATGNVTFTYTVSDNGCPGTATSAPATVTVNVAGPVIWFVNSAAATNGDGRLTTPFKFLSGQAGAGNDADDVDAANHHIFLYSSATAYTGGLTLNAGETLTGQSANNAASFDALYGITPPAGTAARPNVGAGFNKPSVINTGGQGVGLVSNNGLNSLNFDDTSGNAVNSTANVGTLTLRDIIVLNDGSNGGGIILAHGGTSVTSSGTNAITTRSGTGLSLTNSTNIGASNLTFQSINVGSGGTPANGIVLNGTGTAGGLVVTGTSAGQCGGGVTPQAVGTANTVIAPATADCTGGVIQNASGDAVQLNSTAKVSLTRMRIINNAGSGIFGNNVTDFALASSLLDNNSDVANPAEANLRFNNLFGTCSVSNSTFTGAPDDEISLTPSSGTLTSLAFSNVVVGNDLAGENGNGITIAPTNTAAVTVSVTNSVIKDVYSAGIVVNGDGTTSRNVTVTNTTFTEPIGDTDAVGGVGISLQGSFSADLTFNVSNNTFLGLDSNAINVSLGTTATTNLDVLGTINGNVIGNNSVDSGSRDLIGIAMESQGDADSVVFVTNNSIKHTDQQGIFAQARIDNTSFAGGGRFDVIMRDNTVSSIDDNTAFPTFAVNGVQVWSRNVSTLCLDSFSNTSTSVGGLAHFELDVRNTAAFILERFDDGDNNFSETHNNAALVQNFHNAQNDPGSTTTASFNSGGIGYREATDNTCRSAPAAGNSLAEVPFSAGAEAVKPESAQRLDASAAAQMKDDFDAGFVRVVRPDRGDDGGARPTPKLGTGMKPLSNRTTATDAPATAAPAPNAAAPARVWSDMPVIINRAPASKPSADAAKEDEDSAKEDEAKEGEAKPENTEAAPKAKKPAKRKKAADQPDQQQPDVQQPRLRNIAYFGPLGSAPSREVRGVRASYEAGDAVVAPKARAAKAARKAAAARAAGALAAPGVTVVIGAMPASKTVKIRFKVTVNSPFAGGSQQVSNQGTVTADGGVSVPTDDPDEGGATDATVTPVSAMNYVVNDAKVSETTSTTPMVFTVTLSSPAPAGGVTVQYATATGGATPATAGASCGGAVDYETTSGTLTFSQNETFKTVPVNVCADTSAGESDETLLLNLSSASQGNITDAQATGTITQGNAAGTFIISELRTRGPAGDGDDFVELYNNSDTPLTVPAGGYGVFKMGADCSAAPVLVGTVAAGTIPARGHYLLTGSQYSLNNYGATNEAKGDAVMVADIEDDRNVALFATTNPGAVSSAARLDGVAFGSNTSGVCALFREGSTLPAVTGTTTEHSFFRKECDFVGGTGCTAGGNPKDSNDNAADFMFANTNGSTVGAATPHLGAPGPQNSTGPVRRDNTGVPGVLLDGSKASSASPNRERDFTSNPANNSQFGTLTIRRRVVNTTGTAVTRLRVRIIELTTYPNPNGAADLRAISSGDEFNVGPIGDLATCQSTGQNFTPCNITVKGTTLEQPPSQGGGGGYNSTLSVPVPGGLAPNASVNVQFVLGVQQPGTFRFYIIVEALQ